MAVLHCIIQDFSYNTNRPETEGERRERERDEREIGIKSERSNQGMYLCMYEGHCTVPYRNNGRVLVLSERERERERDGGVCFLLNIYLCVLPMPIIISICHGTQFVFC